MVRPKKNEDIMNKISPALRFWRLLNSLIIVAGFFLPWAYTLSGEPITVVYIIKNIHALFPHIRWLLLLTIIAGLYALITSIRFILNLPRFNIWSRCTFHLGVWGALGFLIVTHLFLLWMNGVGSWLILIGMVSGGIAEIVDLLRQKVTVTPNSKSMPPPPFLISAQTCSRACPAAG